MSRRKPRIRVPATEYATSSEVVPALVAGGMTTAEATAALSRTSARLRRNLRLTEGEGSILIDGESVKVVDVAGVLRLAPGVELDVAPKFLGDEHAAWREDLLAISNYTQRGHISSQHVRAQPGKTGDLSSVIGRAFVEEFWQHYRKPLRLYQHRRWRDYSLSGDLDLDAIHERSADGLPQTAVSLDRRNPFNALLARAAEVLIADVRDGAVRTQLHRLRRVLGPQARPQRVLPPVPARHQPWEGLIELSKRIVAGTDLLLHADRYEAPGFVLRTWEAWERMTYLALRLQLGFASVTAQQEHTWGWRGSDPIKVKPDVTMPQQSGPPRLVDAKYKTRVDRKKQNISQADLMEASAFMAACGGERIVLLYPRSAASGAPEPCGASRVFDVATVVPGQQVLGVEVEVRGFSRQNEHRRFSERLTAGVQAAFDLADPDVASELS